MGITFCYYFGPRTWAMSREITTWFDPTGYSIGVLVVSLLLGQQHFSINPTRLILALCCLFSVLGSKPDELFFHFFSRWEKLPNVSTGVVGSALVIALGLGKLFGWDIA